MNQTQHPTHSTQRTARVTVEFALWVLVAGLALALRLARLDLAPLDAGEAREAMLAWRAANGQGMPEGGYGPLLFVANALLFYLFGASDAIARFWPALVGGVLVVMPLMFRHRIGRVGALAAGLYLAISPTALLASRQLNGVVVTAAGGMALLGGLICFRDTGRRSWLTLSVVGAASAMLASPLIYGMLLSLSLAWLSLTWAWPVEGMQWPWDWLRPHLRYMLVVFFLVGLALATGLFWNPAGLEAAGDLIVAWFARFSLASKPVASPFILLAIYEPLALLFGIGGLVWAIRRSHRFGTLLGLWAVLGTLLLTLMPGRGALDTLMVVLPLALLTGVTAEALLRGLQVRRVWLGEWLHFSVVLTLWILFYLRLAAYSAAPSRSDQATQHLILALLTVLLQFLLTAIFALAMRAGGVLRSFTAGTGLALLMVTFSAGWGIAHVRPADPRELLVHEPTAVEVRDLVKTLRDLSWRETGMPTTLPFVFEAAPDSLVAWYLRDFSAACRVEALEGFDAEIGPVLVACRLDLATIGLPDDVEWIGQAFALRRSWDPAELGCAWGWPPQCKAAVEWSLLRRSPTSPVLEQQAVLWLSEDPSIASRSH